MAFLLELSRRRHVYNCCRLVFKVQIAHHFPFFMFVSITLSDGNVNGDVTNKMHHTVFLSEGS